jgi:uncharacterized protein YxjI
MSPRKEAGALKNIDLTGQRYVIRQSLFLNRYKIYNADGELILRAKQKLFRAKEDIPFTDPDGTPVFRIKAGNVLDIAGDYALIDEATGDQVATLHKNFTLLTHSWDIQLPGSDRVIATVTSRGKLVGLLRSLSNLFSFLPHKYTIETADGQQIGAMEGRLAIRDVYDVQLQPGDRLPREVLLASTIAIDALEAN